jgi:hypothetical protein
MEDVFKSVTAAIALAKQLVGLVGDSKNADLKMVVADLSVELAQVKMQLAELMDQNTSLKQKLSVAKGGGPQLDYRDGLYFDADGSGPFCPGCYDAGRKAIRLAKQDGVWTHFGEYKCPSCHEHFNKTTDK